MTCTASSSRSWRAVPKRVPEGRIRLEDLAIAAGVDTDEDAYRLLRLGRTAHEGSKGKGGGRAETRTVAIERVPVVAVLARLERLLPELCPPPDEVLLQTARVLHAHGVAESIGMPRAIVVPISGGPGRNLPPPAMATRMNVGGLLAGRAGIVVDLGSILTDWSR